MSFLDVPAFLKAVQQSLLLIKTGWRATFGIAPSGSKTGYRLPASGKKVDILLPRDTQPESRYIFAASNRANFGKGRLPT